MVVVAQIDLSLVYKLYLNAKYHVFLWLCFLLLCLIKHLADKPCQACSEVLQLRLHIYSLYFYGQLETRQFKIKVISDCLNF